MFNVIETLPNFMTIAVEVRKKYTVIQILEIMAQLNPKVNQRISDYINSEMNSKLTNFPKEYDVKKKAFVTELIQLLNIFVTIPEDRKEKDQQVYDHVTKEWAETVRDFVFDIKPKYTPVESFRPDMVQFLIECQDELKMIIADEFFNRFLPDRKDLNPLQNFTIKS